MLGLVVSDINNPFFPQLIDDFESRARERGIDVIFSHTNYQADRLEHCIQRMIERNVDGIAVFTSEANRNAFEFARRHKIPLVLMNQDGQRTSFNNIYVDHNSGATEAVRHLHALGHRRIAFIAGPDQFDSTRARRRAFLTAMADCELTVRPEWIVEGDLHMAGGHLAMQQLLATSPLPTAILSTNDVMAIGALQAAHEAGLRVPSDLSIIGFDNLPVCSMVTPPLTSVDIPRREIAAHAFAMLLKAFEQETADKLPMPRVPTRLYLRDSTAPPPRRRRA
jgi:LacI family transcriptional regulator